eukprot:10753193-Ditylum_brightwellii.AAC.1
MSSASVDNKNVSCALQKEGSEQHQFTVKAYRSYDRRRNNKVRKQDNRNGKKAAMHSNNRGTGIEGKEG